MEKPIWFNVTNMLVGIALAINAIVFAQLWGLGCKIDDVDNKIFIHMTNHDIHVPRSTMVSRAEFDLINDIRAAQFADIKENLASIRILLISRVTEESRKNKI